MVSTGRTARRAARSGSAVTRGMQTGEAADVSFDHAVDAHPLPAAQARVSGVGAHSDRGLTGTSHLPSSGFSAGSSSPA